MIRRRIGSILLKGCNWYDMITSFDLFREFAADIGYDRCKRLEARRLILLAI